MAAAFSKQSMEWMRPMTHPLASCTADDCLCTPSLPSWQVMPLFHVHGLMAGLLAPLLARGSVVLPAGGCAGQHGGHMPAAAGACTLQQWVAAACSAVGAAHALAGCLTVNEPGGPLLLPAAGKFSAAAFWPDMVAHGCTFYTAVPTIHQVGTDGASTRHGHPAGTPRTRPPATASRTLAVPLQSAG
jgi:acyl-CoA synthetase (AMP-forming)/AMP-acid ligase II